MKLLIINGPNLNLLGLREPEIYGKQDYAALLDFLQASAEEAGVEIECFQSNHEGAIVDAIQAAYGVFDGIVINPAAYTHTSIAILRLPAGDPVSEGQTELSLKRRGRCFAGIAGCTGKRSLRKQQRPGP